MKHSHPSHIPFIVRFVLATVVLLASLCVMAQQGQGPDVNQKNSQDVSSATQNPVKASSQATAPVTPALSQGATSPTGQQLASAPTPPDNDKLKGHSIEAVVIAGLMILVLGLLFVLQLSWSRKLDQTTYLGQVFHDSVLEFERGRLSAPLRENWEKGIYLQEAVTKNAPPALLPDLAELDKKYGYGELRYVRANRMNELLRLGERKESGTTDAFRTLFDNRRPTGSEPRPVSNKEGAEVQEEDPKELEYMTKATAFQSSLDDWEEHVRQVARQKYDMDLEQAKKDAEKNTGSVVDTTEMSLLRGQGPKFVLEFTALIVIIFLAVILGVLGRLDAQQIGTLLAAIAGYVLGKATTSQAPAQTPAQAPAPRAARAEDQGRAAGKAA